MVEKIRNDRVKLIDQLHVETPKTKEIAAIISKFEFDKTVLLVVEAYDETTYLSARNIPQARILPVDDINAYEILRPKQLLVTKQAMDKFVASRKKD